MENLLFDYNSYGQNLDIPIDIIHEFEKEAKNEFPFDKMMMEIHVFRAIRSYAKTNDRVVSIEN